MRARFAGGPTGWDREMAPAVLAASEKGQGEVCQFLEEAVRGQLSR